MRLWDDPVWNRIFAAILAAYVVLAYVYVWTVQPRFGPDEPRHFAVVKRLVEKGKLPLLIGGVEGSEEDGAIALHPPLYYTLMAPAWLAARPFGETAQYLAIKHLSPLILLGALLLFLAALRRLFPDRPEVAALALVLMAFLPEFQLESAVMNNDVLTIFIGSLYAWWIVRTWNEPPSPKDTVIAGLIMAAFVNSKASAWTLCPLWAVALHFRSQRQPERRKEFVRDLFVAYAVLALLGTWWYARNYSLYGQAVPIPLNYQGGVTRPHSSRTGEVLSPLQVYTTGEVIPLGWRAVEGLFVSFWGQIDWFEEAYRPFVHGAFLVLVLIALAGGVKRLSRQFGAWKATGERPIPSPLPVLALGFFLAWATTWYVATFVHIGFYQGGRYLLPAAFGLAALLALGWGELLPRKAGLPALGALAAALLTLNVLCIVRLDTYLNPVYVFHTMRER